MVSILYSLPLSFVSIGFCHLLNHFPYQSSLLPLKRFLFSLLISHYFVLGRLNFRLFLVSSRALGSNYTIIGKQASPPNCATACPGMFFVFVFLFVTFVHSSSWNSLFGEFHAFSVLAARGVVFGYTIFEIDSSGFFHVLALFRHMPVSIASLISQYIL